MTEKLTATQTLIGEERLSDERAIHDYMHRFCRRWAPRDTRDADEFQADFLLVVQAIHRDAIKPMEKALMHAFSMVPSPLFPTKPTE